MVTRAKSYVPDRGDLIWVSLSPVFGHEQHGRRPALVLSPKAYNRRSGLALCCPVTSAAKGYPFEVSLKTRALGGVVLADQVRALAWNERRVRRIGTAPPAAVEAVKALIRKLVVE